MVIYTFRILSPIDRLKLSERYPLVNPYFEAPLEQAIRECNDVLFPTSRTDAIDPLLDNTFDDALRYALELAKNRNGPRFASLAL